MNFNLVILANENTEDHLLWIRSCEKFKNKISYKVVDLTANNWLTEIRKERIDYLLAKPGGFTNAFKQLYDERLSILVNSLGLNVFPSLEEVLIYENKRFLSFWLEANNIPHPQTHIFYTQKEAKKYVHTTIFPIVAKLNIGASGNGVTIINNTAQAKKYIKKIFSKGISPSTGPKLRKGNILGRVFRKLTHLNELKERIKTYHAIKKNPQMGFCLFQEYVPHSFEWRVVRIGNSFYAHKKIVKREKASGSLVKEYSNPPLELLSFVKQITDKNKFYSQAFDIFETKDSGFLINEMQCIFGQSDPYQMLVDNIPGRYIFKDQNWVFEEGMFNTNECFDERVDFVISLLEKNK